MGSDGYLAHSGQKQTCFCPGALLGTLATQAAVLPSGSSCVCASFHLLSIFVVLGAALSQCIISQVPAGKLPFKINGKLNSTRKHANKFTCSWAGIFIKAPFVILQKMQSSCLCYNHCNTHRSVSGHWEWLSLHDLISSWTPAL